MLSTIPDATIEPLKLRLQAAGFELAPDAGPTRIIITGRLADGVMLSTLPALELVAIDKGRPVMRTVAKSEARGWHRFNGADFCDERACHEVLR